MPTRRSFLQGSLSLTAGLAASKALGSVKPNTRPNIVFILADDLGFSDIGPYGSEIETPHLDRLAKEGLRFSQFYNSPRCCPSRSALLTGMYSHQAQMGDMIADYGRYAAPAYRGDLSEQCVTIAEALKAGGYHTMMVGKWHQTPVNLQSKHNWPLQRGFDQYFGIINGAAEYWDPLSLAEGNEFLSDNHGPYLTDRFADKAVDYIGEAGKGDKPFFLYLAFNAPHWPMQAPEEDIAKYRDRYKDGWDRIRAERRQRQIDSGLLSPKWTMTERDPRVPQWQQASFHDWEMRRMAVYAAMIDRMDQGIGKVMAKLLTMSILDNTLVFFMSDNGGNSEEIEESAANAQRPDYMNRKLPDGHEVRPGNTPGVMPGAEDTFQSIGIPWGNVTNTPFRLYKHYAHEGGISTPFLVHWPAHVRSPGRTVTSVGHEIDVMPTCLEAAGCSLPATTKGGTTPAPLEGKSLLSAIRGQAVQDRGILCWEHEGNCAIRKGKWKLVSRFPDSWELFDMEQDRTELHNIADIHPEVTASLAAAYRVWAKRVGAQSWPMPETPPGDRSGALLTPDYLRHDRP